MQVEIREMQPRKAVCMSHRGPYFLIGSTFGQLGAWLKETGVESAEGMAVYYDDPESTPPDELRSEAGAFVAADFTTDDSRVHVIEVAGGTYAVAMHAGPYDGLPAVWMELAGKWLPSSGYAFGTAPGLEIYLNDCTQVAPEDLRTEICVPLSSAK